MSEPSGAEQIFAQTNILDEHSGEFAREETPEHLLSVLKERLNRFIGRAAITFGGPTPAESTGVLSMARGGNFKVQRINLQNSGKLNSKQPMSPEQKRLRKRKRKK